MSPNTCQLLISRVFIILVILGLLWKFWPRGGETPKGVSPPKILVIILGETRSHIHTFSRFKTHLLDHVSADLALCVADEVIDPKNPFYSHAKYLWMYPNVKDWGEAFEFAARTQYYQEQYMNKHAVNWREILTVKDQFMGGVQVQVRPDLHLHKGSAGILLFMRWWLQKNLRSVNYDWYIVTRSDYYYVQPHPTYIFNQSDNIWVVEGEDYGGITDRHAVLPREHVNSWLEFVDTLMRNTRRTVNDMKNRTWNLESLLLWRLQVQGVSVKRFKQGMFTVRDANTTTRWSKGTWNKELKLFVKYPEEYARAMKK